LRTTFKVIVNETGLPFVHSSNIHVTKSRVTLLTHIQLITWTVYQNQHLI